MKLRQSIWVSTVCLALAAVLIGIIRSSERTIRAGTRRLPDGSVLTLRQMAYGKAITIRTGNRWRDYLAPVLPRPLLKKLDCNYVSTGGNSNTLAFSLKWDGIQATNLPRLWATTFDEHGCEFRLVEPSRFNSPGAPTEHVLLCEFFQFPRRSKTVGFRLYQRNTNYTWSTLTEFTVPNPNQRAFPVWHAEPSPITRSVGNVDFTLVEVKTGIGGQVSPPRSLKPGDQPGACLKFRITENGHPTSAWALAGVRGLSDALGHTTGGGGWAGMTSGEGDFSGVILGGLCTNESAWKLKVEFAREANFPSNELWTLRGVPVPEDNAASVIDAVTNLQGAALRVYGMVGKKCPTPRARRMIGDLPAAHLVCTNLPDEVQLKLIQAMDDRGRKVSSSATASDGTDYVFGLNLSADAKSVDLTFAVTKRIPVEYLIKPARFSPEELKKLDRR